MKRLQRKLFLEMPVCSVVNGALFSSLPIAYLPSYSLATSSKPATSWAKFVKNHSCLKEVLFKCRDLADYGHLSLSSKVLRTCSASFFFRGPLQCAFYATEILSFVDSASSVITICIFLHNFRVDIAVWMVLIFNNYQKDIRLWAMYFPSLLVPISATVLSIHLYYQIGYYQNGILALDSLALDIDQVENLIKFCPTKEEMETLKNYTGDKDMLGKCEQFFLELMKVPRVESKLRVFSFTITFCSQVNDLRCNLNTINDATREVKESMKLRQIMQTILTLGNALNQGTARGSAVGFKLDSLLKLSDTRARNNKMTLMHYLCKLLAEKLPELLNFDKDLLHLEGASKIQLKSLAEEMQAVSKGLEKVEQELTASENDGAISAGFQKVLKGFLDTAEAEVRSLISLYSEVGRNADSLSQYFGEDPARCPFEQVTQTLVVFTKMFNKARDENGQQAEAEKKKLEKEALKEQAGANSSARKEVDSDGFAEIRNKLRK
ncbi:unnamed protein product [Ilex paraguariensis]|uniref:Formin-like protein n=1 Tax=Ilex paraguariensis TaxID=185542 RepID=A0ABC8RIF5_9AQUA